MSRTFHIRRQVQFAETDMAGVMHFSNYFRLMEEIEHAWWRSLGLSVYMDERGFSWPRVAVSCEYAAAAKFEDVLDLTHTLVRVGEKSIEQQVEFHRGGERIAVGRMTAVCCENAPAGFRAAAIPPDVRAALEAAL